MGRPTLRGKSGYDPQRSILRQAKHIQELLEQATEDRRLTDAQRYSGMLEVFGCDPLILAAKRLSRAMHPLSKIELSEEAIQKFLIALHDRVVPMPDQRQAKKNSDDHQFVLEFSWATSTEAGQNNLAAETQPQ